MKGHHAVLIGDLVDFHSSREGPRGYEIIHHVTVPELVLDGVGVVWVSLFKELLNVVHGRSRLAVAAARNLCGAPYAGAACSLIDAAVVISRGLWQCCLRLFLSPLAPSSAS
jgi:hypothetical protein